MSDDPPYILDLSGEHDESDNDHGGAAGSDTTARPWIGMHFECCGVYLRVYRNREGTAYEARCPRCARPVRVGVGPGGTDSRMFRVK